MSMAMRVIVPPHPLIGHWLTLLRDRHTPAALYGTAMAELGRWLTYEALRDWLPQQPITVQTPLGASEGTVVDASVPLLAVVRLGGGLGLWQGAQPVLPTARVAHVALSGGQAEGETAQWQLNTLPASLEQRLGVLVFTPEISSGAGLLALLERLEQLGVSGERLRVITAVAAAPGLKRLADRFPGLAIHCACIDAECDGQGRVLPGIGDPAERLFAGTTPA